MKISEMIARLQEVQAEAGDIQVSIAQLTPWELEDAGYNDIRSIEAGTITIDQWMPGAFVCEIGPGDGAW